MSVESVKKRLYDFVKQGGDVSTLKKKDTLYVCVHNLKIFDENGKKLTQEEKFAFLGQPRPSKKNDPWMRATKIYNDFIAEGGNPDELNIKHPVYIYIKGAKLKDKNGKKLTMEEVFSILGADRKAKYSKDIKIDLVEAIEEYRKTGHDFHIPRKDLPFYPKLNTYCRRLSREGKYISHDQAMKDLGYKDYSDLYFRFKDLKNLANYRDADGFVDSYRQDNFFKGYISSCSKTLDLPIPLVVQLLAGERLKHCTVDTEYFDYVASECRKYIDKYGSLEDISKNDRALYSKYRNVAKYIVTGTGENVSSIEVQDFLGLNDTESKFKDSANSMQKIEQIMQSLKELADQNDGKIKRADIQSEKDYRDLIKTSIRLGITTKELFRTYEIDYVDARNVERLKKVFTDEYPYINQMSQRRDDLIKESGISLEAGNTKEEVFEKRVEICLQTYEEFKSKIYNFEEDRIAEIVDKTIKD